MYAVSVKNPTAEQIPVLDLGFYVDADDTQDLTGYDARTLRQSSDLTTNVLAGDLVLITNTAVELTGQAGVDLLEPLSRHELSPSGWTHKGASAPATQSDWDTWLNTAEGMPYMYNPNHGLWLSVPATRLNLFRAGKTNGAYVSAGGSHANSGCVVDHDSLLIGVAGTISSGDDTKEIEIRKNKDTTVHTFNLTGSEVYNGTCNVQVSAGDRISLYVSNAGEHIRDPQFSVIYRLSIAPPA